MPVSNQHLLRSPEERQLGVGRRKGKIEEEFNRVDMVLQAVCTDIINGLTKNDIILKFANKEYEYQKKPLKEQQAKNYIKAAYLILAEDRVKERDQLKDQLYNQYMMLYNDLVVNGNSLAAKQVLDSIGKIFLQEPISKEISVKGNNDGTVDIKFSFGDSE